MQTAPRPDHHSAAFWDGLRRHEVVVQRCSNCGAVFFPHLPTCPRCASRQLGDEVVSGRGTVYSWVRVHRALGPDPVVEPPYAVVTVDLETASDGDHDDPDRPPCRMFGRLVPPEVATVGLLVVGGFVDHEGWTELVFHPRLL